MAFFIKFVIVGQKALRNNTEKTAALKNCGTVIESAAGSHRQSGYAQSGYVCRALKELLKSSFARFNEPVLRKKIRTGIAGYAKLRQSNYLSAAVRRRADGGNNFFNVFLGIGNRYARTERRCLDKAEICHIVTFLCRDFLTSVIPNYSLSIVYTVLVFKSIFLVQRWFSHGRFPLGCEII